MIDRRSFLATAAAGLAVPVSSAPAKIRTGIIGIQHGHLTPKVQAIAANPAYELVAVSEPDEATWQAHAGDAALRGLKRVAVDEMLADSYIHLVVFEGEVKDALPAGMRVLEAGKHLHLEKPPANRLEPFRVLVNTARERALKLQLGYLWRHHAGTDAALEAFRKGWLGEVYMIRATINADRDAAQRLIEARYPGGTMFELGGHMIDRVIAFFGRPEATHHWLRHDTSAPDSHKDNTLAVLEYPKALALVMSSAKDPAMSNHRSFEVIGTDGSMMVQPMEPVPVLRVEMRADRGPYRKGVQEIRLPPQPRFIRDFDELARAINSGSPLAHSYDHELLLQETLLRAAGDMG